ncbi:protocadherin beta-18-like [Dreissena polymorpha]|uniref:protocadherin beta-18-like n=1 Tax=Dreissena polymorpha TaxID=45954 RepID=UPI002264003E|nr:protocadherin beta-18-like [Dreissena polymorpha]XP_052226810.1 protocadherin beta-18-like [Dreissena polymorpha]
MRLYKMFALHLLACVCLLLAVRAQEDGVIANLAFNISEGLENGTYIGNIAGESKLGLNGGYNFRLSSTVNPIVSLTPLGELRTAYRIDRETECRNEVKCSREFQVTAHKDASVIVITVTLNILDVNDETPTFDPSSMTLRLSEAIPVETLRQLPAAVDLDKGPNNGVAGYEFSTFVPPSDLQNFALVQVVDNNTNAVTVSLKIAKALDHEVKNRYVLQIFAKDAGQPIRTGTLTVTIDVIDENDNKPVFENSKLNVTVTEDISVGKTIVSLLALDKDSEKYGEVEYTLSQPTMYISEHFTVNSSSGELKVAQKLNYEAGSNVKTIYIVARDKGELPLSSTATVLLTIKDAGNKPPKITATILVNEISPNVLIVSEAAKINDAIMYLFVTDSDSGDNGQVSCSIVNTYFGLVVNGVGYNVFVQHSIDRETQAEHNLTVRCSDLGGLSTSASFKIKVGDVNDHTPTFDKYLYLKNIEENNTYGSEVLRLRATDDDIDDNARITYSVDSSNEFEIVMQNDEAVVRAKITLDREKYAQKIFHVLAVDNGNPRRTGTATVQLNILDINDMAPMFTMTRYVFRVTEGSPSNTRVDFVTAIDEDQGENQRLRYEIMPQYAPGGALAVPFTVLYDGEVKTTQELDREMKASYSFKVLAVDFGIPAQTGTVEVLVNVEDINDNMPIFVFPSADNNTVTAYNEKSETEIVRLQATDMDSGINQELIYFIVEGDPDNRFSLDPSSGKLYIVKYVHLTADKLISLLVAVYDKGKPQLSSKASLNINLRYTNSTNSGLGSSEKSNNSYVIIVVTVVCITCLLSVTIITVICLIRRKDIHKCGKGGIAALVPKMPGRRPESHQTLPNDKVYPTDGTQKNKKEVSFSLADGDSLTSHDKITRVQTLLSARQAPQAPLVSVGRESDLLPASLPRPLAATLPRPQTKYSDTDVQMVIGHHREDSHSETSGETTTSHDSGKGGSVEGDHEPKFEMNPLNPSAYLILDGHTSQPHDLYSRPIKQQQPSTNAVKPDYEIINSAHKDKHLPSKSSVNFPRSLTWNPKQCHNLNSTGSYPDSDYLSLGSNPNLSHVNTSMYPNSGKHVQKNFPHSGYVNSAFNLSSDFPLYSSNSLRDDDEATTTSGSYTVNHEDLEDDLQRSYTRFSDYVV